MPWRTRPASTISFWAGYSGTAAQASFLAVPSHRAVGLMIGGFPLLAGYDYFRGFVEGTRAALQQAGLQAKADEQSASCCTGNGPGVTTPRRCRPARPEDPLVRQPRR